MVGDSDVPNHNCGDELTIRAPVQCRRGRRHNNEPTTKRPAMLHTGLGAELASQAEGAATDTSRTLRARTRWKS